MREFLALIALGCLVGVHSVLPEPVPVSTMVERPPLLDCDLLPS